MITPRAGAIQGENHVQVSGCSHAHTQPRISQKGKAVVSVAEIFESLISPHHREMSPSVQLSVKLPLDAHALFRDQHFIADAESVCLGEEALDRFLERFIS